MAWFQEWGVTAGQVDCLRCPRPWGTHEIEVEDSSTQQGDWIECPDCVCRTIWWADDVVKGRGWAPWPEAAPASRLAEFLWAVAANTAGTLLAGTIGFLYLKAAGLLHGARIDWGAVLRVTASLFALIVATLTVASPILTSV
jgi:hypothetical protein